MNKTKIMINGVEYNLPEGVKLYYCRTEPKDDMQDYKGVPSVEYCCAVPIPGRWKNTMIDKHTAAAQLAAEMREALAMIDEHATPIEYFIATLEEA